MRGTFDIDPITDIHRNTPADIARVAHMIHKHVDGDDRNVVLSMLFGTGAVTA